MRRKFIATRCAHTLFTETFPAARSRASLCPARTEASDDHLHRAVRETMLIGSAARRGEGEKGAGSNARKAPAPLDGPSRRYVFHPLSVFNSTGLGENGTNPCTHPRHRPLINDAKNFSKSTLCRVPRVPPPNVPQQILRSSYLSSLFSR